VTIDRWNERLSQILMRAKAAAGRGEAATQQALILPMLEMLGYEIWNPLEVCPEFEGDFAIKKAGQKEKVDLAVLFGDVPRIFFEVKPVDVDLEGHQGQLARYFNAVPSVSLGVLTNGLEYRFFTDTGQPNIMDPKPFFVFRVDHIDPRVEVLARFSKSSFDAQSIRDFATDLIYTATITAFLREQLDLRGRPPAEEFTRWILSDKQIYEGGRVTASVVERFQPIIGSALSTVLREIVRRSVAAIDQGVNEPAVVEVAPVPVAAPSAAASDADAKRGIVTTEAELRAYEIVRNVLTRAGVLQEQIFEPSVRREVAIELGYNDTTAYFGCYLNKSSWWIARLWLDVRQPSVGFPLPVEALRPLLPVGMELIGERAHAPSGVRIGSADDLALLGDALVASARYVIEQRRPV
jgi:hypothetical protein